MSAFFHLVLYTPLYNLLIFLVGIVPGGDIGIAVILATLIVKLVLLPLSLGAARTQKMMKFIEPELKEIRALYKDDKEKQAKEMFALYDRYGIKPFGSFLTLLIQLPIIIGLYWVFRTEALPHIDTTILYSFVHVPAAISALFLGIVSVTSHSLVLAGIAGATQLLQAIYAIPVPPASVEAGSSAQDDFARAMTLQARFVLPFIIGFVAYASGAIALYFITSNASALIQEYIVRQGKAPVLKSKEA